MGQIVVDKEKAACTLRTRGLASLRHNLVVLPAFTSTGIYAVSCCAADVACTESRQMCPETRVTMPVLDWWYVLGFFVGLSLIVTASDLSRNAVVYLTSATLLFGGIGFTILILYLVSCVHQGQAPMFGLSFVCFACTDNHTNFCKGFFGILR